MIVRCSYCRQLLRVDENSFPDEGNVKVRCPHCEAIGRMSAHPSILPNDAGDQTGRPTVDSEYPTLLPYKEAPPSAPPNTAQSRETTSQTPTPAGWSDTKLPSDAFQRFRSPAEREKGEDVSQKRMDKKWKYILWAVISLAVIGFFALLVNIVLPGPGGVRPTIHSVPPH